MALFRRGRGVDEARPGTPTLLAWHINSGFRVRAYVIADRPPCICGMESQNHTPKVESGSAKASSRPRLVHRSAQGYLFAPLSAPPSLTAALHLARGTAARAPLHGIEAKRRVASSAAESTPQPHLLAAPKQPRRLARAIAPLRAPPRHARVAPWPCVAVIVARDHNDTHTRSVRANGHVCAALRPRVSLASLFFICFLFLIKVNAVAPPTACGTYTH